MSGTGQRRPLLVAGALALAIATAALFAPAVRNGFILFDDNLYLDRPEVRAGLSWSAISWAFGTSAASNWHPLTWIGHIADWQLFGVWAGGHHLVDLLFHAANVALVFAIFHRATKDAWCSAIVAALFGWHPLRVESVAWIAQLKDVLSAFFGLLSLYAWVRWVEERRRAAWQLALLFFLLGLLAKPMLVTLPVAMLLFDRWPLRRPFSAQLLAEKVPFLLASLGSAAVTMWAQWAGGSALAIEKHTPAMRAQVVLLGYARYLGKTLWPAKLSVFYPMDKHPGFVALAAAALLLAALAAVVVACWTRAPAVSVGLLWFFAWLLPVIGIVQVGLQSIADRYTYLPSIGLAFGAVYPIADRLGSRRSRAAALSAAALALAVLGGLTIRQIRFWRDTRTLFGRALELDAANAMAMAVLGVECRSRDDLACAEKWYRAALSVSPDFVEVLTNLARLRWEQGHPAEAAGLLERAHELRPKDGQTELLLARALEASGDLREADRRLRALVERHPERGDVQHAYGELLGREGQHAAALAHLEAAVRAEPGSAGYRYNLGIALARLGRFEEAIRELEQALRLQPRFPEADQALRNAREDARR